MTVVENFQRTRSERFNYVAEEPFIDPKYRRMLTSGTLTGPVGFVGKTRIEILKRVIAVALTFAAGAGVIHYSNEQAESAMAANEIEQEVDLPNEAFGDYDLGIKSNGTAVFVDDDGNKAQVYDGINANDLVESYGHSKSK